MAAKWGYRTSAEPLLFPGGRAIPMEGCLTTTTTQRAADGVRLRAHATALGAACALREPRRNGPRGVAGR